MTATAGYLFEGADWDFSKLQRIHDACEEIARSELGLEIYPNQIEVITAEQMLDAYSSVGMPLDLARHIVNKKAGHFEPDKFEDRYETALVDLINQKRAGKPITAKERPAVRTWSI
jgi:spore cortex formation protein SpoVR/YcgB (stage V sporulation)